MSTSRRIKSTSGRAMWGYLGSWRGVRGAPVANAQGYLLHECKAQGRTESSSASKRACNNTGHVVRSGVGPQPFFPMVVK